MLIYDWCVRRREIQITIRYPSTAKNRCETVSCDGLVYAVATDPVCADGLTAQTRNTLAALVRLLIKAGSGKAGLLQAAVYLSDIKGKPVMDEVWGNWIGPVENWPQRACVGAGLDEGYLIEVVVTAKML